MRLAFAVNYGPAPAVTGASIRSQRLARALAEQAEVVVYCKAPPDFVDAYAGHPDLAPFSAVRVLPFDARGLAAPNPQFHASIDHWDTQHHPIWAPLARDHERAPFDAIICEQIFTAGAARALPDVPMVLSEHNIESRVLESIPELAEAIPPELHVSVKRARAHEAAVWEAARLVTCVTDADAEHVRAHRRGPIEVVPNGVDAAAIPFSHRRGGEDILFVGALFWPPNVNAALFLAGEVMPRVWKQRPRARLTLCGAGPTREVSALAQPGVVVTGLVPSVHPYLARAAVYANALFAGEGSSLKVLEPLAAGVPLVSTSVGVRGFPLRAGEHFVHAESADEFAASILTILESAGAHDGMASRGRELVQGYDWATIGRRFAEHVAEVVR